MKAAKLTEEQIGFSLRQGDLGTTVADVCRTTGISEATYFHKKQKYGGLRPLNLRQLTAPSAKMAA